MEEVCRAQAASSDGSPDGFLACGQRLGRGNDSAGRPHRFEEPSVSGGAGASPDSGDIPAPLWPREAIRSCALLAEKWSGGGKWCLHPGQRLRNPSKR
jgi:hypothetical protein